jgi:pilus assembly protein Flp/PilA
VCGLFERFVREDDGVSMAEYGLMVGLIAVVCLVVLGALGQEIGGTFDKTQKEIKDVGPKQVQVTP